MPTRWANRVAFMWLVAGVVLATAFASVRERRAAPPASALAGVLHLCTDYAGSEFLAPRSTTPSDASRCFSVLPGAR